MNGRRLKINQEVGEGRCRCNAALQGQPRGWGRCALLNMPEREPGSGGQGAVKDVVPQ